LLEDRILALLPEGHIQFVIDVEIVLDRAFATTGDEDDMLDSGFEGLIDNVLNGRTVNDGQHFLRDGLGRRQNPRAHASDR